MDEVEDAGDLGDLAGSIVGGASKVASVAGSIAGTGSKVGEALGTAAGAAATGASIGAAVGSIIPGLGTVIGGAIGAIGGFFGGLFSKLFGGDGIPDPPSWREMVSKAKGDPRFLGDLFLYRYNRPAFDALAKSGGLPNEVLAKHVSQRTLAAHAREITAKHLPSIRKLIRGLSEEEQTLVGLAALTKTVGPMVAAIQTRRARVIATLTPKVAKLAKSLAEGMRIQNGWKTSAPPRWVFQDLNKAEQVQFWTEAKKLRDGQTSEQAITLLFQRLITGGEKRRARDWAILAQKRHAWLRRHGLPGGLGAFGLAPFADVAVPMPVRYRAEFKRILRTDRDWFKAYGQIMARVADERARARVAGLRALLPGWRAEAMNVASAIVGGPAATYMPADQRPRPDWHIAQTPMPRPVFESLLVVVPFMRTLPDPQLLELAGLRGRASDVAGVDPVDGSYVETPGETPSGIADKLVGDADRAVELVQVNRDRDPATGRWRLPPSWFQFVRWDSPFVELTEEALDEEALDEEPFDGQAVDDEDASGPEDGDLAPVNPDEGSSVPGVTPSPSVPGGPLADPGAPEPWHPPMDPGQGHEPMQPPADPGGDAPTPTEPGGDTPEPDPETPTEPGNNPDLPGAGDVIDPGQPAPGGGSKANSGPRPNTTSRVYVVRDGDTPIGIAKKVGYTGPDAFKALRAANPHKPSGPQGWSRLDVGEMINIPNDWPQSALTQPAPGGASPAAPAPQQPQNPYTQPAPAPQQPQNPYTQPTLPQLPAAPTVPGGGTVDPGVLARAQVELAAWGRANPASCDPADFGQQLADVQGASNSDRFRRALSSFQRWANGNMRLAAQLRTDGLLDAPSYGALDQWAMGAFGGGVPGAMPGGVPQFPGSAPAKAESSTGSGAALALVGGLAAVGGLFN